MIDWFASKLGLLIFVMGTAAVLIAFFVVQADVMEASKKASVASDIARLIDSVSEGAEIIYEPSLEKYQLEVCENFLKLDGTVRYFISDTTEVCKDNPNHQKISDEKKLKISKSSGKSKVEAVE